MRSVVIWSRGTRMVSPSPRISLGMFCFCSSSTIAERVLEAEAGVERRHLRGRGPHDEESEEAEHQHGDDGHGRDALQTQTVEELNKTVH